MVDYFLEVKTDFDSDGIEFEKGELFSKFEFSVSSQIIKLYHPQSTTGCHPYKSGLCYVSCSVSNFIVIKIDGTGDYWVALKRLKLNGIVYNQSQLISRLPNVIEYDFSTYSLFGGEETIRFATLLELELFKFLFLYSLIVFPCLGGFC